MRAMRRGVLVLLFALVLGISAGAAVTEFEATKLDVDFTVAADGSYSAVLTAALSFDGADTAITIPLGPNVTGASAAGYDTALSRTDGVYFLTLTSRQSFCVPGTYTVSWTGTLPFSDDAETGTSAELTLLCAHWPGSVSGVSFSVELPNAVPDGAAKLMSGYYGELTGDGVSLVVSDKKITGSLSNPLLDHESLTLELALPGGFFTAPGAVASFFAPDRLIVPLLVLAAALYWFFTLRSPRVRVRRQMIPPDGVCAGDVPLLLFGARPDAALTVVQWASLGYLTVARGPREIVLTRTMGMGNERKGYERRLFSAIFSGYDRVACGAAFRRACAGITRPLAAHWNRRIFDRKSGSPALLRLIASASCAAACGRAGAAIDQLAVARWVPGLLLALAGAALGFVVSHGAMAAVRRERYPLAALAAAGALCMLLLGALTGVRVGTALAALCAALCGLATASGGRRTRAGCDMLARLRSLRAFLTGAQEKQLRRLLRQDPQYYYRMLPFACALGVGRAFSARFGQTRLEPCGYFAGAETTTAAEFYAEFSQTLQQMQGK